MAGEKGMSSGEVATAIWVSVGARASCAAGVGGSAGAGCSAAFLACSRCLCCRVTLAEAQVGQMPGKKKVNECFVRPGTAQGGITAQRSSIQAECTCT